MPRIFPQLHLLSMLAVYSTSQAATLKTLYNFTGAPDGASPYAGLAVGHNGELYGTTYSGGAGPCALAGDGCGTAFELTPPSAPGATWTEITFAFPGKIGGARPNAALKAGPNGWLYGTTTLGPNYGAIGTVFALKPPTSAGGEWSGVLLATGGPAISYPDGAVAIGTDGTLYSTSWEGGSTFDRQGDVFSVTPPTSPGGAWVTNVISDIWNCCGQFPESGVVMGPGGVLYGASENSVYSVTPPATAGAAWTTTMLHSFCGPGDGCGPVNSEVVMGVGRVLYGATAQGGAGSPTACVRGGINFGCGTVYSLTPPASHGGNWTETVLYSFNGGSDGAGPSGVTIGPGGVLYGTTPSGGAGSCDCGTVFSVTPPTSPGGPWTKETLYSFSGSADGATPMAGLLVRPNGALYGTTSSGGSGTACAGGCGTVFALLP